MMKHITVVCCLFLTVSAGPKDQKTTLEDIERDYLADQKRPKLTPPSASKIAPPVSSPTQFGFVPTKTIADYVQQTPRLSYVQPQYPQTDYTQYTSAQQQPSGSPQKYTTSFKQYNTQPPNRPQQKYTPQVTPQQSYRYVSQIPQVQYQSYDNVQYITDNNIGQATSQYYTPQYVYLQQYSSPSTAVQTVVDPKGGIQYVMYIPTYVPTAVPEQTQNYESIVYTPTTTQDTSAYQTPDTTQTQYEAQAPQKQQQVQYVQSKTKYTKSEYVPRREPKSLLDSYIPSYVQLQYYNQAQQNSIQEPIRVSQSVRSKNVKSSYRPAEPASAEASLTYRYQPSSYKS